MQTTSQLGELIYLMVPVYEYGEFAPWIAALKGQPISKANALAYVNALKAYIAPLQQGLGHLQQATMWFMNNASAKPDNAGAGATDYMHLFGLVAMGYMWAKIAKTAQEKKAQARVWLLRAASTTALYSGAFLSGLNSSCWTIGAIAAGRRLALSSST